MGHNVHGINLYGVVMTLMDNLHAGGQSSLGHLRLVHRFCSVSRFANGTVVLKLDLRRFSVHFEEETSLVQDVYSGGRGPISYLIEPHRWDVLRW